MFRNWGRIETATPGRVAVVIWPSVVSAKGYVTGDSQYEDSPLGCDEWDPVLVIHSRHLPALTMVLSRRLPAVGVLYPKGWAQGKLKPHDRA